MIRVLVVDDSAVARSMLVRGLERYPDIRVIGEASDVYEARDHILTDDPDVITLDIRMPRMDGVNFLRKLMPQYPKAVVIVSALDRLGADDVLAALEAGAVDVVAKPGGVSGRGLSDMLEELVLKVRAAADADVSLRRQVKSPRPARRGPAVPVLQNRSDTLIAVGASTGGTVAVGTLLSDLPPMMPGILVTLHMPPIFTEKFAERLNQSSPHDVKEARDGVPVRVGSVLVAPGDRHMAVFRIRGEYRIRISDTPKVNGHKPSVGVLFSSVAREAGPLRYWRTADRNGA